MLNRDFDHLSTLLHLFFERDDICQKLNIIDQNEITGWEVWFQVEFANMLCSTDHEWWREQTLSCDMRKKPERPTLRTDFLLRKKAGHKIAILRLKLNRTEMRQVVLKI